MDGAYLIMVLAIAAGLGLIPANIAKKKGYSFGLWWFYGWMLFIVAIIHVSLIPDKNAQTVVYSGVQPTAFNAEDISGNAPVESTDNQSATNVFDQIIRYKELLDDGVLTQEEFDRKKKSLLNL